MYTQFESLINEIFEQNGLPNNIRILDPPAPEYGDFCIVANQFTTRENQQSIVEEILPKLKTIEGVEEINLFETKKKKKKSGILYLNFRLSQGMKNQVFSHFAKNIFSKIFDSSYGISENNGISAVVEHTSANPISPLHVGNLRNSIHGDTIARIMMKLGYNVKTHFYVNDVGLQIAYVIIGYEIMKKNSYKPTVKIDNWIGQIYALMHNFYSIYSVKMIGNHWNKENIYILTKQEIQKFDEITRSDITIIDKKLSELDPNQKNNSKEIKELKFQKNKSIESVKSLNSLFYNHKSFNKRFPKEYKLLLTNLKKIDLFNLTSIYLQAYENNDDERIVKLFREVVDWVLDAFTWTLNRYNIKFDYFDYESDISWSGIVTETITILKEKENISQEVGKALRYSYPNKLILEMCKKLEMDPKKLPIKGEIPSLQLTRSDGTALYAAKDIGYSIVKHKKNDADIILNVISAEQSLPQFQLILPLYQLGWHKIAKGMQHYSYENVELKGRPMSGRRALYVTADDFYDETVIRARMAKRLGDEQRNKPIPNSLEEWNIENETLQKVAIASTRFPLVETAPNKKIILDIDRELDFRRNSGPFIQYAHARAHGILEKAKHQLGISPNLDIEYDVLQNDITTAILRHLQRINIKLESSFNELDPSIIANWTFVLAQSFMKFYEQQPIISEDENIAKARLTLVYAVKSGIAFGLDCLGINPTDVL